MVRKVYNDNTWFNKMNGAQTSHSNYVIMSCHTSMKITVTIGMNEKLVCVTLILNIASYTYTPACWNNPLVHKFISTITTFLNNVLIVLWGHILHFWLYKPSGSLSKPRETFKILIPIPWKQSVKILVQTPWFSDNRDPS